MHKSRLIMRFGVFFLLPGRGDHVDGGGDGRGRTDGLTVTRFWVAVETGVGGEGLEPTTSRM